MRYVIVHNLNRPDIQPLVAGYCTSFFCQLRGLMFARPLLHEKALALVQAKDSRLDASIHMLFMRMDLAVAWINSIGKVVDVRLARRWRPAYLPKAPAKYVLEMNVSRLQDFEIGDQVRFDEAWVD